MAIYVGCSMSAGLICLNHHLLPARSAHISRISAFTSPRREVEIITPRKSCAPPTNGISRVPTVKTENVSNVFSSPTPPASQKIFSDESRGIVCYRNESGEITCEGFDEGPHFHPPVQNRQARFGSSSVSIPDFKSAGFGPHYWLGESQYTCISEYVGELFCEGKADC